MTRQHFQAIAEALRLSQASQETIDAIADVCNRYNPNFDSDKFDVAWIVKEIENNLQNEFFTQRKNLQN